MRKKTICKLIILCFFFIEIKADPLGGVNNFYYSSRVLFSHCSLIPYQKFYPSLCEFTFSSKNKNIDFKYSSILSFKDNGFAFGYRRLGTSGNIISTAYGMKNKNLSFGAAFSFYFNNDAPSLLFNLSSSFDTNQKNRIALSVNNLSEICKDEIYPEIVLESGGSISQKIRVGYNIKINYLIDSSNIKKCTPGLTIDIKGKILNQPYFIYSFGYGFLYEKMSNLHNNINIGIGSIASFFDKGVGLLFGYSYNFFKNSNSVQCNLHFDPLEFIDVTPPVVLMNVTCRSDKISGYYVTMNCLDNVGGSGIKNWTLVFSDKPTNQGILYKIFSGGNTVPSTVYWDLRDKNGTVLDSQPFYSRLVVIDKKNNIGVSPWIYVSPCKW